MKKVSVIVGAISLTVVLCVIGCGDKAKSPEDVAKSYIDEKFKGVPGDLSDLDYEMVEEQEGAVKVKIEGEIKYEEVISLVKNGNEWVMATAQTEAPKDKAVSSHEEAAHEAAPQHAAPEAAHH